jgi:hypothetical protein
MTGQSAVTDFVAGLFNDLGYAKRTRVVCTRRHLSLFFICGEFENTQTDVCIIDHDQKGILLLVREDKRLEGSDGTDPEAQLIAKSYSSI